MCFLLELSTQGIHSEAMCRFHCQEMLLDIQQLCSTQWFKANNQVGGFCNALRIVKPCNAVFLIILAGMVKKKFALIKIV